MLAENGLKDYQYIRRGKIPSLLSACLLASTLLLQVQPGWAETDTGSGSDKAGAEASQAATSSPSSSEPPAGTSPSTVTGTEGQASTKSAGAPPTGATGSTSTPATASATEAGSPASTGPAAATAGRKRKNDFADVLPCLTWVDPDVDVKAILLCVHGLGLHNDSYDAFGKAMSKRGYLVYAVDVPGFGSFKQAEGRERVDFEYCLRGIGGTLKFIHKVNPKVPVFILGESMGGAIALRFTAEHPEMVDGLISSVPSGDRFKQGGEKLKVGLKLLTSPNKEFNIGSSVIGRATQKDSVRKHWAEDPLNRMNLTPKELLRFQDFMNENHDSAKNITRTPVLFVQGCKDKLVRPEGTMELYNRIGSEDRALELIHDGEHLIFEEGQFNDQVITMVDKWLVTHIDKTKQLGSK